MDEVSSTYTREEVAALVEESRGEGLLEDGEYDRLSGALGFTEKTVETVLMRPETLQTVRRGSTGADVEALCAATGFSRFPVVGDDGDLLGYLHIKDVLETDEERRHAVVEDKWIRPFALVHDDDLLHDTLEKLQRRGAHMARVVDATGTTLGAATLEDVIEELVGEIRDSAHLESPTPRNGGGRVGRTVRVSPADLGDGSDPGVGAGKVQSTVADDATREARTCGPSRTRSACCGCSVYRCSCGSCSAPRPMAGRSGCSLSPASPTTSTATSRAASTRPRASARSSTRSPIVSTSSRS